MLKTNLALLKIAKRAESNSREHLLQSFVDLGPLFTLLASPDHQVMFGRRGTGKTHVLSYLASQLAAKGFCTIEIDMRSLGSTGGIYSDPEIPETERATRLLVDVLLAIYERAYAWVVNKTDADLQVIGPLLDKLLESSNSVVVKGTLAVEGTVSSAKTLTSSASVKLSAQPSVEAGKTTSGADSSQLKTVRTGTERLRVHFGSVHRDLEALISALPNGQLWLLLDEWSEVPMALQPILADLLRRAVFPVKQARVKIAAIEQRSRFRIPDEDGGHIGIEIGADAAASLNLDEFLVFENDPEQAVRFFKELFYRHVNALEAEDRPSNTGTSERFVSETFTQANALEELVRACEGVPRDAINIAGQAAQKTGDFKISVPSIREAAYRWYQRVKQKDVESRPEAMRLLTWIIDEVIKNRRARAFLVPAETRDSLIDYLFDQRVLHLIRQGISAQDLPGRRFNVYSLDYGCYVDLMNTGKAPLGLLLAGSDDADFVPEFVEVPKTDFRAIRRSILDLDAFYESRASKLAEDAVITDEDIPF